MDIRFIRTTVQYTKLCEGTRSNYVTVVSKFLSQAQSDFVG